MISPKLVTAIFLLTPVTSTFAQGQSEITAFLGLRTGGSFRVFEEDADPDAMATDILSVQSSLGFGIFYDYRLSDSTQIEFVWSHQRSETEVLESGAITPEPDPTAEPQEPPTFDIGVDYFHGAFLYTGGAPIFQPYVAIGAGAAVFDIDLAGGVRRTKFSFSVGTGFKSFFSDRLGFRFDARAFGSRIGDQREDVSCGVFGCVAFERAATFWQGQIVGGLVFTF